MTDNISLKIKLSASARSGMPVAMVAGGLVEQFNGHASQTALPGALFLNGQVPEFGTRKGADGKVIPLAEQVGTIAVNWPIEKRTPELLRALGVQS